MVVVFLLSNRNGVTLGFWPFATVQVVLGAVVIGMFAIGFLIGLLFHLPSRLALGRRARRAEKRVTELEARQAVILPAAISRDPLIPAPLI